MKKGFLPFVLFSFLIGNANAALIDVAGVTHPWSAEGDASDSVGTANGTLGTTTAFATATTVAALTLTFVEDTAASEIDISISGALDLAPLTFSFSGNFSTTARLQPFNGRVRFGPGGNGPTDSYNLPAFTIARFGTSGISTLCSGFSGTRFGFGSNAGSNDEIRVEAGYTSGSPIAASMTCPGTFASQGITSSFLTFTLPGDQRIDYVFISPPPSGPDCAILGEERVDLRGGSDVVAAPSNVCSNGTLRTGAQVNVDTSLLALGDMQLGDGTEVGNDAFMNGNLKTGARVYIGFADGPDDVDVDAGGDVTMLGGTQVEGECQYGLGIFQGPSADCGTVVFDTDVPFDEPFVLPECAVTPPNPQAFNIKTGVRQTAFFYTPLSPGDYGNVSFGPGNKVALEAGEYHFQSLYFGPNTEIEILGPITVHVMDSLRFANGVKQTLVGVEPSEILYLLDGAVTADPLHKGGASTTLYGTLCGPGSRIVIGDGSELTGAIIAKEAVLGAKVRFIADPAPVQ